MFFPCDDGLQPCRRAVVKNMASGALPWEHCITHRVTAAAAKEGLTVHIPSIDLCGDNAAMIAAVGYHRLCRGEVSGLDCDVYSRAKNR